VGAVAGRVFLDADPLPDDLPLLAERGHRALAIGLPLGRDRRQKPLRVL
jgi:hypothetical protein